MPIQNITREAAKLKWTTEKITLLKIAEKYIPILFLKIFSKNSHLNINSSSTGAQITTKGTINITLFNDISIIFVTICWLFKLKFRLEAIVLSNNNIDIVTK